MKIRPEIDIFEDPELCENGKDECPRLLADENSRICGLFADGPIYDFSEGDVVLRKCDQCKADWTEAKLREPIDSIVIDGHPFECLKRPVYGNCKTKIMTSLICDDDDRLRFLEKVRLVKELPVSTHGIFNHVGKVLVSGMFPVGDKMHIEIMVVIGEWMVEK